MRKEFRVNGVRLDGRPQISLFTYDNDTFVIYPYVDNNTFDSDLTVFVEGAVSLTDITSGRQILPLYTENGEAVFRLRAEVGKFRGYRISR